MLKPISRFSSPTCPNHIVLKTPGGMSDVDLSDLLPQQCDFPSVRTSGHTRRAANQKLPRPFLLFNIEHQTIFGAMLLDGCARVRGDGDVFWNVGRAVHLSVPVSTQLEIPRSKIFNAPADVETTVRTAITKVGGCLNDHFADYAGSRWRLWPCDRELVEKLSKGAGPFTFQTTAVMAKHAHVVPDTVDQVPDAAAAFQHDLTVMGSDYVAGPEEFLLWRRVVARSM